MVDYSQHFSTRATPQSEAIPGKDMTANSAGGYGFTVDDWTRLDRFLILGSEDGSYYAGERELTRDNAESVLRCIKADGPRVVRAAVAISVDGRAPKNDPALFVLAMAASLGDLVTRQLAFARLPKVARIGTHLFHFVQYAKAFRGWGRAMRGAIADWYTEMPIDKLALQAIKYKQRGGWSHRDLLRLAHPKTSDDERNAVFSYTTSGHATDPALPALISAARIAETAPEWKIVRSIIANGLPREAIPTEHLNSPAVWGALLEQMPMTALIRNLGKMTSIGLLAPMSDAANLVAAKLSDGEALRKSRMHPLNVLSALVTYGQGHGFKGSLSWNPVSQIVDALDAAFYASFENVESTGKRTMLAIDISRSMGWTFCAGMPHISCRVAAAALAMVTARTEPQYMTVVFAHALTVVPLSPRERIDDVVNRISSLTMGGTDCAQPMLYALEHNLPIDVFHIYTDSETWCGTPHPSQALRAYRERTGINAKLVVWGMAANPFTIADPNDGGMFDVVGLDASAPSVVQQFLL